MSDSECLWVAVVLPGVLLAVAVFAVPIRMAAIAVLLVERCWDNVKINPLGNMILWLHGFKIIMAHIAVLRSKVHLCRHIFMADVACVVDFKLSLHTEISLEIKEGVGIRELMAVKTVLLFFKKDRHMLFMVERAVRRLSIKLCAAY